MTKILWKQLSEYKAVGDGRVDAVMSTESVDRDGDIIKLDGWDLKDFASHPVLMADHNYDLLHQIGKWTDVRVEGGALRGTATYHIGKGNPHADWAFHLAEQGEAAFSVGFIPDMEKAVELDGKGIWGSFEFHGQKLLETSQVAIPSNPDAVQLSARATWAKSLKMGDASEVLEWTKLDAITVTELCRDMGSVRQTLEDQSKAIAGLIAGDRYTMEEVIDRLKADYPEVFKTIPDLREVVSQW